MAGSFFQLRWMLPRRGWGIPQRRQSVPSVAGSFPNAAGILPRERVPFPREAGNWREGVRPLSVAEGDERLHANPKMPVEPEEWLSKARDVRDYRDR